MTSICSKGGLGRSPSKHRIKRIENDHVGYLCTKHRISAWNEMKNNYEIDIQRWLMLIYSQSKLTCVLFLGGKSRRGWVEKLGSTLGLYFSKRGLVQAQKHCD